MPFMCPHCGQAVDLDPPAAPSLRAALERLLYLLDEYERAWQTTRTGYAAVTVAKGEARAALAGVGVPQEADPSAAPEQPALSLSTEQFLEAYDRGRAAAPPATGGLDAIVDIVKRHTHQGMWAMTRFAGPDAEHDCQLCRALVAAGVLTLDEIGAGTRAAIAATLAGGEAGA